MMTPNEEELLGRIADALERIANPPAMLECLPPGYVSEADRQEAHREWIREAVAVDQAVAERSAKALESIAAAWGKRPDVEVSRTQGGVPVTRKVDLAALEAAIARKNRVLARSAEGWKNAIELNLINRHGATTAGILAKECRGEAELVR